MTFWTREVAGWIMILLGLYAFYCVYDLIFDGTAHIIEEGALTIIGIFVFRGGIHLLKVAVAARLAMPEKSSVSPIRFEPRQLVRRPGESSNRR